MAVLTPIAQADLLALILRLFPPYYTGPLQSPGPGWEAMQMFAAIGARVSEAVVNDLSGGLIATAAGGSPAHALLTLTRPDALAGACTVKKGSQVATADGLRFLLLEDVAFGALDTTGNPTPVLCRAPVASYAYNRPGPTYTASAETLPGDIVRLAKSYTVPAYADPTITATQVADASGGVTAFLDILGSDRGLDRARGETDATYRWRIRQLPDVVSPAAIRRALQAVCAQWGAVGLLIEPFDLSYQAAFDMSGLSPAASLFVPDDPRPATPFCNRYLGALDERGGFIVWLPRLQPLVDVAFVPDDAAMWEGDLRSTQAGGGVRAWGAYDLDAPSYGTAPAPPAGCFDGFDIELGAAYKGVWDLTARIKAASVDVALEREGN